MRLVGGGVLGAGGAGADRGAARPTGAAPSVTAIWIIARLTVAEAARRRILWVLLGLTLVSVAADDLGHRAAGLARPRRRRRERHRDRGRGLAGADPRRVHVQLRAGDDRRVPRRAAIAADLESGVAHAMLARPIRRADLVVGRWLGLVAIVVAYAARPGCWRSARFGSCPATGRRTRSWRSFSLAAQAVVLLTFAMLLSTRLPAIAGGAICVVLFGLGWMAGRLRRGREVLRCRPAGGRGRGIALAAAERWPVAGDDLRARAFGGHRGRRRPGRTRVRGQPVLRVEPAADEFLLWSVVWVALILGFVTFSLSRRDL